MNIQTFAIKLENSNHKSFSIDKISGNIYTVSLSDSIYSGEPPIFNTPEDAFLFVLEIMKWIPSSIIKIETTCEFLSKEQIIQLCGFDVEAVCY